jgi:ribosomal protein L29
MLSTQEIRQLQTKELHDELARATRELVQVRMDIESGTSKESHKLTQMKKHIARIKNIMKEQLKDAPAPALNKEEEIKAEIQPKEVKKVASKKASASSKKTATKAKPIAKKTTKATKK